MAYAPWLPRSNPRDIVIAEEPPNKCHRERCPNCGCKSLVNHCWFLFPRSHAREAHPLNNECGLAVCFVCQARVGVDRDRIFVFPTEQQPPCQRCCYNPKECKYARTVKNGICCP